LSAIRDRHFADTSKKYGPFRVALLPIGAYLPRWAFERQHMGPKEAIQAALDLRAMTSIAMHFDTFQLADEAFLEAPLELQHLLRVSRFRGEPTRSSSCLSQVSRSFWSEDQGSQS